MGPEETVKDSAPKMCPQQCQCWSAAKQNEDDADKPAKEEMRLEVIEAPPEDKR